MKPTPNLMEFFSKKVKQALCQQGMSVSGEVEFYLVQLLNHFAVSKNYFQTTEEGKVEFRALALKLYDAVFDAPEKRYYHLKSLGDTALYHAGVFYDGLYNQAVSVDYYISMGGQAYQSLANLTTPSERSLADLFAELSERFPKLVEILKLSSETELGSSDNDILKLLDRYQKTGSETARQLLKEKGISPEALLPQKIMQ